MKATPHRGILWKGILSSEFHSVACIHEPPCRMQALSLSAISGPSRIGHWAHGSHDSRDSRADFRFATKECQIVIVTALAVPWYVRAVRLLRGEEWSASRESSALTLAVATRDFQRLLCCAAFLRTRTPKCSHNITLRTMSRLGQERKSMSANLAACPGFMPA